MIDNWIKRKKDAKEKKEDKGSSSSSSSGHHLRNYEAGHTYGGLKTACLQVFQITLLYGFHERKLANIVKLCGIRSKFKSQDNSLNNRVYIIFYLAGEKENRKLLF